MDTVHELIRLYADTRAHHHDLYQTEQVIRAEKNALLSDGDIIDATLVLKKIESLMKDSVSTLLQLKKQFELIACSKYMRNNNEESLRGKLAVGKPKLGTSARIPKRVLKYSTDETVPDELNPDYVALMRWCGVDHEIIECDALRPHWPGMTKYYCNLEADGLPTPPGVNPAETTISYVMWTRELKDAPLDAYVEQHFNSPVMNEEKS